MLAHRLDAAQLVYQRLLGLANPLPTPSFRQIIEK